MLKWRKAFEGTWQCYLEDDPGKNMIAECVQDDFGRNHPGLWSCHIEGIGKITDGIHDRFSLKKAKALAERRLRLAIKQLVLNSQNMRSVGCPNGKCQCHSDENEMPGTEDDS